MKRAKTHSLKIKLTGAELCTESVEICLPEKYWFACDFDLKTGISPDNKDYKMLVPSYNDAVRFIPGLENHDDSNSQYEGQLFTVNVKQWKPSSEKKLLAVARRYKELDDGPQEAWMVETGGDK